MRKHYEAVEIDGVLYMNPAHAAELLGISRNTMYKLLQSRPDLSFEDAIKMYLNKDGEKVYSVNAVTYKGVTYNSTMDACNKLGLNFNTIYYRMRTNGISFEQAVEYDRSKQSKIDNDSSAFGFNLSSYCKEKGLNYRKMYRNISELGMSLEEAERLCIHNDKYEVTYQGKVYKSLFDACLQLDVSYQKMYTRMKRKGITFEEAMNLGK